MPNERTQTRQIFARLPDPPDLRDQDVSAYLRALVRQIEYQFSQANARRQARIITGEGSPEGVVEALVGTLYARLDGGTNTTLYVKESGTSDTGWRAVTTTDP